MQLELKDLLISPFYFKLDNKGRKKIFSKINTDIEKLAKKIGCSKYTLKIFQNNYRFIRYDILKKLLILSNLNTNTIEKHVISVKRGCSNREVEINLPIKTSPELANLIAKGLGDGGISLDNRFFYTNQQIELINEVISNTNKAIGKNKHTIYFKNKSKCYEMKFSSVIGFVLNFFGVPIGYKIGQKVDIPIWIKEGNKEIKKMFIRGLFDDEACVNFIKSSRSRRIIFSISKRNKYAKSLTKFLKSLQDLLNEFKIKSNSISIQNKSEDKIVLRFTIQNKESLENYKKQIYFTHPKKRETLEKILKSYKDTQKIKKLILKTINESNKPLNTTKIFTLLKINRRLLNYHLNDLYKRNKINKNYKIKPVIWYSKDLPHKIP